VTLQGLARLAIDSNDHTVRVTGKVHPNFDLDLAELFFDLLFLLRFAPLDIGPELARDAGNFVEKREFPFIEVTLFMGEACYQRVDKPVNRWLERVRLIG
jgi:hypothetical protein